MKLLHATAEYLSRWDRRSAARKCPACRRAIRPGEWIIHHEFRGHAYADATIHTHRACMLAVCDEAPATGDTPIPTDPLAAAALLAERHPSVAT